jgi:hypothetical protein
MRWSGRCVALAILVTIAQSGCGPGNGLNLGRVRGRVTYKGEPVKNGSIHFMPDSNKGTDGPPAMGVLTADGTYILSTDESGDGALVGYHKVGITGLEPTPVGTDPAPDPEKAPVDFMKAKARAAQKSMRPSPKKSGDTFTDRAGRTFRHVTPKTLVDPNSSGISAEVCSGSNILNFDVQEDGRVLLNR